MTDGIPPATPPDGGTLRAPDPQAAREADVGTPGEDVWNEPLGATPPLPVLRRERVVAMAMAHPVALGLLVTLGGVIAIALTSALASLSTILIYIVLALFVALALDPIVRWLGRRRIPRVWAIVLVYGVFLILVILGIVFLLPAVVGQIAQLIEDLPQIIADFEETDLYGWLNSTFGTTIDGLLASIEAWVSNPANLAAVGGGALKIGVTVAQTISGVIIVVVLSLYFLAGLAVMKQSFYRLAPARGRETFESITEQITGSLGACLIGMVTLGFFNSIVTFLLFTLLGLPAPLAMAVLAFGITLIPVIGSVVFWIVGSLVALVADPTAALVFALAYLVYMQLEAYLITPRLMNKAISVPGSLVIIGALVGGTLAGLLGALVAIPVTASILLIIKQVLIPRQDART
jgi:predicted PurR-regulated permease PerM